MKICVCGGGNLGHVTAGFLAARKDCEVTVMTRRPERWSDTIEVTDSHGRLFAGRFTRVTADAAEAVADADIVILCLPGFAIAPELKKIKPWLRPGVPVGSIISNTGFFFEAMETLPESTTLFGFQRVPFISRITEYGKSAELKGYKSLLKLAVTGCDSKHAEELRALFERLFETPTELLDSFYEAALSNSNPLLHPSRLYTLWGSWRPGMTCDKVPGFYEDWTTEAAQLLIDMDLEFQALLRHIGIKDGAVPSITDYYEVSDAATLTAKIRSIEAFRNIAAPMKPASEQDRFVPDFSNRYFTEDFPYGLRFIIDTAAKNNFPVPVMKKVYDWGISCIGQ